jgi:hypothetical protein
MNIFRTRGFSTVSLGGNLRNSESFYRLMKVHEFADYQYVKVKSVFSGGFFILASLQVLVCFILLCFLRQSMLFVRKGFPFRRESFA